MAAAAQRNPCGIWNPAAQSAQAAVRSEEIPVARQHHARHCDAAQSIAYVKALDQMKTMGHDTLVRLPALASDKLKEWPGLLPASKKQVEELIDEWIVGRQRVA